MQYNQVMLAGNLTRDPQVVELKSGTKVARFGLASNRRFRNKAGEKQEETLFIDCECFNKTAELVEQYLKKGRNVFVSGRLKLDQWEDGDGNKRSKINILVNQVDFLDRKEKEQEQGSERESANIPI
jgi:single-strand DNA-binding protein